MKARLAWLLGGFALLGFLRRRREPVVEVVDPRAEELRRKLAEARSPEEPEPAPELSADPEERRRAVHESAQQTVKEMRGGR